MKSELYNGMKKIYDEIEMEIEAEISHTDVDEDYEACRRACLEQEE